MMIWSFTLLLAAIGAALLGFTTVAGVAYVVAKVLFFLFLILFVFTLLLGPQRKTDFV